MPGPSSLQVRTMKLYAARDLPRRYVATASLCLAMVSGNLAILLTGNLFTIARIPLLYPLMLIIFPLFNICLGTAVYFLRIHWLIVVMCLALIYYPFSAYLRDAIRGRELILVANYAAIIFAMPLCQIAGVAASVAMVRHFKAIQLRNQNYPNQCPECGYSLEGSISGGCPECGWRRTLR